MAHLAGLRVYPVKGLDGIDRDAATILDGGTLQYDREFALFDADGEVINGKRTPRVHDLDTDFDPKTRRLRVKTPDGDREAFDLDDDSERAAAWFGDFFGADLTLARDDSLGYVDRRGMGPSVVSTATLEELASWYEAMTVEGARRRLRANVEIGGVPAFWEDRFVGADAPSFRVGGVRFDGVTPCGRCVVPARDPDTGEATPEFQQQFVQRRKETFPDWADVDAFDHFYSLMILTDVIESDRGQTLSVGDGVEVVD